MSPSVTLRLRREDSMSDLFFNKPVLNAPYDYPSRHWDVDEERQPTGKIVESRRSAERRVIDRWSVLE